MNAITSKMITDAKYEAELGALGWIMLLLVGVAAYIIFISPLIASL